MKRIPYTAVAVLLCLVSAARVRALDISAEEWNQKMKLIDDLKTQVNDMQARGSSVPNTPSAVDTALDSKYGPNDKVTVKNGTLYISLLTQVWYYGFKHDNRGLFDNSVTGIRDTNATQNTNSFRIRRTELGLNYDLNENIFVRLMIDPSRESQSGYANLPDNQGNIKRANVLSPEFAAFATANKLNVGLKSNTGQVATLQGGGLASGAPKLMQDAFINWHNCIPHHDFTIGQFKPLCGEEGIRNSGELDFIERSMIGFQADNRDLGACIHGSWWNCPDADGPDNTYAMYGNVPASQPGGRFQYWVAAFDGAGTYFDPGNQQNRPDTNNEKDINARVLVRPLWDKCAGHLELGASFMGGTKGASGTPDPINAPFNNLNRQTHWADRANAWLYYRCGNAFAKGLWVRGEANVIRDQENPGSVLDVFGNGVTGVGTGNIFSQAQGQTFSRSGGYAAIGYDFGNSQFEECIPCWLKPVEVLGRWEEFQNVDVANLVDPTKTDRFYTQAYTAGMNYYITKTHLGHVAKVQANYIFVKNPDNGSARAHGFHDVHNNAFALNFQVMF